MTHKKEIDEKLIDDISKKLKPILEEFEKTSDPLERAKKWTELTTKGYYQHVIEISKMSNSQFEALEKKLTTKFQALVSDLQKNAFESLVKSGHIEMKNMGLFITKINPKDSDSQEDAKAVDSLLRKKEVLERLYKLELMARASQEIHLTILNLDLKPLTDLEKIVKTRFGNDINWCFATAILSTHENLVKKKLIDLNTSENEIKQVLQKTKFQGLVKHLGNLIEEKEKRKLSLSFYKSPSLREIRNRLDHEGYKQPVTKNDVINLINEINQFEKELFVEKKSKGN